MEEEDKIKKALMKKALGYDANDIVEEYVIDEDGGTKSSKKKITKKHYSPDISAVKVLLERYYKTYEEKVLDMTDESLQKEKTRLEKLLKGEECGD